LRVQRGFQVMSTRAQRQAKKRQRQRDRKKGHGSASQPMNSSQESPAGNSEQFHPGTPGAGAEAKTVQQRGDGSGLPGGEGVVVRSLTPRSFSWRRQSRFPTRLSPGEIRALAQQECRELTHLEKAVLALGEAVEGYGGEKTPENHRDAVRNLKLRVDAAKALVALEGVSNQLDDHVKAKRPTGTVDPGTSGNSAIPPGQAIGNQVNVLINNGSTDERRLRFLGIRDRLRTDGIPSGPSGSGQGSDSGRIDQAEQSARTE